MYLFFFFFFMYLSEFQFCPGLFLGVGLLDYVVILFLILLRNHILFSIAVTPFYILTSGALGFHFLHILINSCYFMFFFIFLIVINPNEYEVLSCDLVCLLFIKSLMHFKSSFNLD